MFTFNSHKVAAYVWQNISLTHSIFIKKPFFKLFTFFLHNIFTGIYSSWEIYTASKSYTSAWNTLNERHAEDVICRRSAEGVNHFDGRKGDVNVFVVIPDLISQIDVKFNVPILIFTRSLLPGMQIIHTLYFSYIFSYNLSMHIFLT